GIPIYNNQQYAEAVLRASLAAQKNPAIGESNKPLVPAPKPAAKPGAARKPAAKPLTSVQKLAAAQAARRIQAQRQAASARPKSPSPNAAAVARHLIAAGVSPRVPTKLQVGHHMTSGALSAARKLAQQQAARGR